MEALQLRCEAVTGAREAGGGPGVAGAASVDGAREAEHRMREQLPSYVRNRCVSIVVIVSSSKRAAIHNNDGSAVS